MSVPVYGVKETSPPNPPLEVANLYPWSYSASQPYPACAAVTSTTCGSGTCTATITQPTPAINTNMHIGITGQSDSSLNVADSTSATWDYATATGIITINTAAAHGLTTGDVVCVKGPTAAEYIEGCYAVTVSDTDTFTYTTRSGMPTTSGTTNVTVVWAKKVTQVVGNDVSWASSKTGTATGGTLCPKRRIVEYGKIFQDEAPLNAPYQYWAATWNLDNRPQDAIKFLSSNLHVFSAGSHCGGKRCAVLHDENGEFDLYQYTPGQPSGQPWWNLNLNNHPLLGKGNTADLLIYKSGASLVYRTISTQSAQSTKRNFNTTDSCTAIDVAGNGEGHLSDDGAKVLIICDKADGSKDFFTYDWSGDSISTKVNLTAAQCNLDNARPLDSGALVTDCASGTKSGLRYWSAAGVETLIDAGSAHAGVTTDDAGQEWLLMHEGGAEGCPSGSGTGQVRIAMPAMTRTCIVLFRNRANTSDDFGSGIDQHFSCVGNWCVFEVRLSSGMVAEESALSATWFNDFTWHSNKLGITNVKTGEVYWLAHLRSSSIGDFFASNIRPNAAPPADLNKATPPPFAVLASNLRELASGNSSHLFLYGITSDLSDGTTPTLTSITPDNGTQGTTVVSANFAGTNMSGANPVLSITGTGVTFANLTQTSATLVEADVVIDLSATPVGARNVQYCTDDGCSGTQVFTVNAAAAAPTLSSISPSSGWRGSQLSVVFTGTAFDGANPALASSCGSVTFPSFIVNNATTITAQVLIGGAQSAGTEVCNLSVSTDDGPSETRTFTVNTPPQPISSTLPAFF